MQETVEISDSITVSETQNSLENGGPSIIQTTIEKKQRKQRPRTSSIWDHFTTKGSNKVQCKHCMSELSGSTSSLKYHLDRKHKGGERELNQKTLQQVLKFTPPLSNERQHEVNQAVIYFFTKDLHLINDVSGKGFQHLLKTLKLGYICPHRTTFGRNYIPKAYEKLESKVREEVKQAIYIRATTDMGSDDFRQLFISR